jgi:hypothetical protein
MRAIGLWLYPRRALSGNHSRVINNNMLAPQTATVEVPWQRLRLESPQHRDEQLSRRNYLATKFNRSDNSTALRYLSHSSVALVSVCIGAVFERRISRLRKLAEHMGALETLIWTEADFLSDPIISPHAHKFRSLNGFNASYLQHFTGMQAHFRPFCAAFKPAVLLRAMLRWPLSYVLWTDCEPGALERHAKASLRMTAYRLSEHGFGGGGGLNTPQLGYGLAWSTCRGWYAKGSGRPVGFANLTGCHCVNLWTERAANCMMPGALADIEALGPAASGVWRAAHVDTSFNLLANTAFNRAIVADWLSLAVAKPRIFCGTGSQDEFAYSLVLHHYRLPALTSITWNDLRDSLLVLKNGVFAVEPPGACVRDPEYAKDLSQRWCTRVVRTTPYHESKHAAARGHARKAKGEHRS